MRKRFLSVLLSLIIVCGSLSAISVQVKAVSSKIENALQWAISIANDNSHGYSQSNRWGPDYDCSSFVISALKYAGFDVGSATYTGNMRSQLTQHGFTWIPWSQISSTANLMRGDILLNEVSHTEFYLGNGQNIGAHSDRGYPQTGDQTGTEVSASGYYNHPWDGVLRYIEVLPPINPTINKNQVWYDLRDTIEINVHADNATSYYMSMFKDDELIIGQTVASGTFSLPANTYGIGNYSVYFTCVNSVDKIDSPWIEFSVVGEPGYSNVYSSNWWYDLSDIVSITVEPICSKGQVIGIDKEGVGRVITQDCDYTYNISASELGVGKYSAYFSVYNGSDSIDTKRIEFEIVDSPKEGAVVSTSKSTYHLKDDVNISVLVYCSKNQFIGINKEGVGRVITDEAVNGVYEIKASDLGVGEYTVYFSVANNSGSYDTELIKFRIVDYTVGDVTNDNAVNVSDATEIQKYSAGVLKLEEYALKRADVDYDGKVNIKDSTAIQKYTVGIIKEF